MKIIFITPAPDLSGGQRVIAIHADQLLERGHEVTVVSREPPPQSARARLRDLVRGGRRQQAHKETHFARMKARLVIVPHAGPIRADDLPDADIVIATWWETAFEIVHLPASKGRKVYFVQGHEVFPHLPKHISGASYFLPLRKITIASWLVDVMLDLYQDGNVALVPNGVQHRLFFAPERERQPVPTVGFIYTHALFKGVDIALRAINIARQSHPHLHVIAFGTEEESTHLPLPKGTEFHLRPLQESLRSIYASCDVFLSASRSEGFSLPILEAMACRTPVVATLTGCAKDVIEDNVNGYAVNIDDAEALGAQLVKIISMDSKGWKKMSDAAHQKALAHSWEKACDLFELALFDELENLQNHRS